MTFRARISFKNTSTNNDFFIKRIFAIKVNGKDVDPKDFSFENAKTITFNLNVKDSKDQSKNCSSTIAINAEEVLYIQMTEEK